MSILNIFDFDGTLFRSPVPNPRLWDRTLLGKLLNTLETGGYGWFQNTLTLSPPYVPSPAPSHYFNSKIVKKVKASMKNPEATTVLLTGRSANFEEIITGLLRNHDLEFDHYGFKEVGTGVTTKQFKERYVRHLVSVVKPDHIRLWEDRANHVQFFKRLLSSFNVKFNVMHVQESNVDLEEDLERELVDQLIQHRKSIFFSPNVDKKQKQISFSGIKISKGDRTEIFSKFPCPEGWTPIAHHLTLNMGKLQTKRTKLNLGQEMELRATHVGSNKKVMALKVDPENKFEVCGVVPHITLCTAPGYGPKESNFLKRWTPIEELRVQGKVKEWGIKKRKTTEDARTVNSKKKNNKEKEDEN
eukprot:TRINITY_DN4890_c0_g1_i1.p1 TRINITY_DN4890_c0_g1~~TRINITY_DN4890_c0_g1_i1.p1  ORF type:complete len:358 (+),score=60.66 TRINITY_DN4890_c0_g1_i1:23-1096(+)